MLSTRHNHLRDCRSRLTPLVDVPGRKNAMGIPVIAWKLVHMVSITDWTAS